MAGVLIKIGSMQGTLAAAEKRAADYISNNPEKAGFMSIIELSQQANVSIASVSRLSKKLGYSNYKKLKADLARELIPNGNIALIYQEIEPSDSDEKIIEKAFLGNIKSLEDTLKILDRSRLIKAAKMIAEASRIVFFGVGSSGQIARDAALRFALLDIQAESYGDPHQMIVQALRMKKKETAIAFSHSGRSRITVEALHLARKSGAKALGISNYMKSALHNESDIFLCTSFAESRVKVAALSSRIAQMCLVDSLYLLVARYKKILKKAELFNDSVERLLRV